MAIFIKNIYKNPQQKWKEPETILFHGAIYECTFNVENKFITSQICVVLDLPSQYYIDGFWKTEDLVAPYGLQDLEYNVTKI